MGKYKPYPEYKDSGVEWLGDVPEGWGVVCGKRIFSQRKEVSCEDEQLAASQLFGVIPQKKLMELTGNKVMLALNGTSNFRRVRKDDFVISLRSFEGGVEYSAFDGCVSPAYTVLKPSRCISSAYFKLLLKSKPFVASLQASTDSLRDGKSIPYEQFGRLILPIPSFDEQTQIAAFLDQETVKIDRLIEKQEKLIELLKEKRQAVISYAVTKGLNSDVPMKDSGVEWLGEVPEHWGIAKVGHYATVFNGSTPSKMNIEYWTEGDVPWLSSSALNQYEVSNASEYITRKALAECSLKLVPEGAVLVGMVGQGKTRGQSALLAMKSTINQNMAAIVCDRKLVPEYLHFVLQSSYESLRELGRGGNQAALNCEIISSLYISIPSVDEQYKIVRTVKCQLDAIGKIQEKTQKLVDKLKERRTALISAAVTGKIDVRDWNKD